MYRVECSVRRHHQRWFDFESPEYDPLPAKRLDSTWVLLDGHTRAFLAALSGAEGLRLYEESEELQYYRTVLFHTEAHERRYAPMHWRTCPRAYTASVESKAAVGRSLPARN